MTTNTKEPINYYSKQINEASKHSTLYQYTDLDCLTAILKTKTIKLNNLCNMDDKVENSRLDHNLKGKIYVSCFTNSEIENIPLWYLYGIIKNIKNHKQQTHKDILRFSVKNLNSKCFGKPYYLDDRNQENLLLFKRKPNSFYIKDLTPIDVLYNDRLIDDAIEDHPFDDNFTAYFPSNPGYIKGSAWSFEYETRILLGLFYNGIIPEIERIENHRYYLKQPKNYEALYLPIKDKVFNTLRVTFSPWADEEEKQRIKELVNKYLPAIKNECFTNSTLEGKIKTF